MKTIHVTTQTELDAAIAEGPAEVVIGEGRFECEVRAGRWIFAASAGAAISVTARGNSTVTAWENSTVTARGNSTVTAWENSTVTARENSTVTAWENSTVTARENSTVTAWGNSTVSAWGNSTVTARGNVFVRLWRALKITATAHVVILRQTNEPANIQGGRVLDALPTPTRESSPDDWLEFYGVELKDGAGIVAGTGLTVPIMPDIDAQILKAINQEGNRLYMGDWHQCETTHCRAGWAIHLAGKAGYDLEKVFDSEVAGSLLYAAAGQPVPDFYATNDEALEDMKERAAEQAAQQ